VLINGLIRAFRGYNITPRKTSSDDTTGIPRIVKIFRTHIVNHTIKLVIMIPPNLNVTRLDEFARLLDIFFESKIVLMIRT
jgi:hypothetical protein